MKQTIFLGLISLLGIVGSVVGEPGDPYQPCTVGIPGMNPFGCKGDLVCHAKACKCPSLFQNYDYTSSKCLGFVGSPCDLSKGLGCSSGSKCSSPSGLGTCNCEAGKIMDAMGYMCQTKLGDSCTPGPLTSCQMGSVCGPISNKCECEVTPYAGYGVCAKKLGDSCTEDYECSNANQGSTCRNNKCTCAFGEIFNSAYRMEFPTPMEIFGRCEVPMNSRCESTLYSTTATACVGGELSQCSTKTTRCECVENSADDLLKGCTCLKDFIKTTSNIEVPTWSGSAMYNRTVTVAKCERIK